MIPRITHLLIVVIIVDCVCCYPTGVNQKNKPGKSVAKRSRNRPHQRPGELFDYDLEEALLKNQATSGRETNALGNGGGRHRANKRSRKAKNRNGHRNGHGQMARTARGRNAELTGFASASSNQLLGLGKPRPPYSTPFVSVGVFGDMRKFFDELRTDLDTVQLTDDGYPGGRGKSLPSSDDEIPNFQALRLSPENEQRRQSRLRNFVSMAEPVRRKNQYDPALLWTGLGR